MTQDILIGLDAGTSVIKAVAFDISGQQLAVASRRNSYTTLPNGGVEQDMRRTWADAAAVLKDLASQIDNLPNRALALAVTGQGDGTWLIDADGVPVHDGWLWLDARASAEARELAASPDIDRIYEITGAGLTVCQMRTHFHWLKRHAPELLERAVSAMHCKDWLYFNLTGIRAADPTEGVFTFGDFRTRAYSEEAIEALGLSDLQHLLPPIVDGARQCHTLTRAASDQTGLPEGLPVVLAYVDVMCSALGAGLHDPAAAPG
ncbi:MAG: carbohydrate kinase, partial [Rhodobacteraceae bacterium]|nr:carbohydrate kinase [Paracoccaceae bacterium]